MKPLLMATSEDGIALIKRHEGFVAHLYNDRVGHCTIGYGHLVHLGPIDGRAVEIPFQGGISREQAEAILRADVRDKAERFIRSTVTVDLTQEQFDALADLAFNLGGAVLAGSTLVRALNAGQYENAAKQFGRWVYAGHPPQILADLVTRRAEEAALFEKGMAICLPGSL